MLKVCRYYSLKKLKGDFFDPWGLTRIKSYELFTSSSYRYDKKVVVFYKN